MEINRAQPGFGLNQKDTELQPYAEGMDMLITIRRAADGDHDYGGCFNKMKKLL